MICRRESLKSSKIQTIKISVDQGSDFRSTLSSPSMRFPTVNALLVATHFCLSILNLTCQIFCATPSRSSSSVSFLHTARGMASKIPKLQSMSCQAEAPCGRLRNARDCVRGSNVSTKGSGEQALAIRFSAYGMDWLAFAHLVIAAAFIRPYIDPLRNKFGHPTIK